MVCVGAVFHVVFKAAPVGASTVVIRNGQIVTALEHARSTAQAVGEDVAERVEWVEGGPTVGYTAIATPDPEDPNTVLVLSEGGNRFEPAGMTGGRTADVHRCREEFAADAAGGQQVVPQRVAAEREDVAGAAAHADGQVLLTLGRRPDRVDYSGSARGRAWW